MQRLIPITILALAFPLLVHADRAYDFAGVPLVESPKVLTREGGATKSPGNKIRIATYNIQNFEDGVGDKKNSPEDARKHGEMAAAILAKVDADIVVLEEIENEAALKLLNDALPAPYPVGCVTDYGTGTRRRDKLNDGLLSRLPIEDMRVLDFGSLTGDGKPTRGALGFTVNLGGNERLLVYVVHLKSNYGVAARNIAQRRNALAVIRADADRIRKEKADLHWEVAIAGDFNVDPDLDEFKADPSLEPFADWNDLWRGRPIEERATLPTRIGNPAEEYPPAAFDRFIVSPELAEAPWRAQKLVTLPEGSDTNNVYTAPGHGSHVSDHYPVYMDIEK